jgi:hypothetical protein
MQKAPVNAPPWRFQFFTGLGVKVLLFAGISTESEPLYREGEESFHDC